MSAELNNSAISECCPFSVPVLSVGTITIILTVLFGPLIALQSAKNKVLVCITLLLIIYIFTILTTYVPGSILSPVLCDVEN